MRANNSLQARGNKPKFSVAIQTPMYQKLVNDTLGDPERARRFVAAISSAVAVNPALQACDAGTVLTAALLGESLNLSPSPQLGQYYLVPYNDKRRGPIAQFQLGYKGYIQLAIRSGMRSSAAISHRVSSRSEVLISHGTGSLPLSLACASIWVMYSLSVQRSDTAIWSVPSSISDLRISFSDSHSEIGKTDQERAGRPALCYAWRSNDRDTQGGCIRYGCASWHVQCHHR